MNFAKLLRTPFLTEHLCWMLLLWVISGGLWLTLSGLRVTLAESG